VVLGDAGDIVTFSRPQWRTRRVLIRKSGHYVRVWLGQANGLRAVEAQGNAGLRALGIARRYGVVLTPRRGEPCVSSTSAVATARRTTRRSSTSVRREHTMRAELLR
jgi:hypothetical protein